MARLTSVQRAERVLRFLMGMRDRAIARTMRVHGFGEAEWNEGWALLQGVAPVRFAKVPATPELDPLADIEAWKVRWLPVLRATVERRFPTIAARTVAPFGDNDILAVKNVLDLCDAPKTDEERGAVALLAKRGIGAESLATLRTALLRIIAPPPDEDDGCPTHDEVAAAEARLWSWYLEWSQIARHAVRSRRAKREMGLVEARAGGDDAGGDEAGEPG